MQKLLALLLCGIMLHVTPVHCYVSEIDEESDVVTFVDYCTENEWLWEGVEDWQKYDDACLWMFDCGTEEVTDDIIIRAIYERSDSYGGLCY